MKCNFRSLVLPLLILSGPVSVMADSDSLGLFVEPMVTYELGSTSTNYPSPLRSSSGNIDGLGVGARAGFHFSEVLFAAGDLRYSMPRFDDSSVSYNAKAVATNWGLVVGMQMPTLGLRVWGTYVLGGELNPEASSGLDVKFSRAQGYRIGAGFRVTAVSLNLEYQALRYDSTTLEQLGPFSSGATLDGVVHENKSWLASVSFPLEL